MTMNVNTGYEECVGVTRFTMNVIGLWPLNEKQNFFAKCKTFLPASFLFFFIILPQTRKAISSHNDLNLMIEVLTTADIIEGIALLKLFGLWYNKQDLKKLVIRISHDWENINKEEQVVMWENAKLCKIIAIFCISSTSGSVLTHTLVYFITVNTMNENATKPLFLKSHFPFETHYSPVYEIISVCQFSGAMLSCFAFSSFDSFFVCSILHFSSQLCNLNRRIKNLVTKQHEQNTSFVKALEHVVLKHQHLVSYTDIIENNFNKVFLVQVLATSVALCMQGYQFVMIISESGTKLLASLIFILVFTTGNVLSLFMYCYIAEIIRNESKDLFYAVYEMHWYKLPAKDANLLLIVMCRLTLPIEITVGKFAVFSLEYFSGVVKTSVGYLSVLLAVRQKLID